MRQISGEFLRSEITRLGSIVLQTWAYHPSGILLHQPGDVLTVEHAAVFEKSLLDQMFLLEPGEDRKAAAAAAGVQLALLTDVTPEDALAEDVAPPGSRNKYRAGTALEPAVVEALKKDRVGAVLVCRGAASPALKGARIYLDLIPVLPGKMLRPDPVAAAATTCAWALVTPRAKVLAALSDDMARLRVVNALMAAGHEALEVKRFEEVLDVTKSQRPDAVIVSPEGAVQVCRDLRKKGEGILAMVIAVCGDPTKMGAAAWKALEAGANDILPLPVTPGLMADRVGAWMRLRNRECSLPKSIVKERRGSERRGATMTIRIWDPGTSRPLSVTTATLLDISDGGLRLEYGLLEPPDPGAFLPHGVHPSHGLFPYARGNALGRDFMISLTGRDVPAFESPGRFAHVSLITGSERAGVAFVKRQEGAAARVTRIIRKPIP